MKKTLQVERNITLNPGEQKIINIRLKDEYAKCTGFFLSPSSAGTNFSAIDLGLSIAQKDLLPIECDALLFAMTDSVGRDEATYDFSEENIPAKSSTAQLTAKNRSDRAVSFNAYFVLSNN